MYKNLLLVVLLFGCFTLFADQERKPLTSPKDHFSYIVVPVVGYGSDDGLGFGAFAQLYRNSVKFAPYKYSIGTNIYITLGSLQSYTFFADILNVAHVPLRIKPKFSFNVNSSNSFCGLGKVTCSKKLIDKYVDEKSEEAGKNFYLYRNMDINLAVLGLWLLDKTAAKKEVIVSLRSTYYLFRSFKEKGTYINSLYEKMFGPGKNGLVNILQLGFMVDGRNNEINTTSGYWLEAGVRAAATFLASDWTFAGFNMSGRGYVPLNKVKTFSLASQLIVDGLFGDDIPIDELAKFGGTQEYIGFGGSSLGRGFRSAVFVGRLKSVLQIEARYFFYKFNLLGAKMDLGGVGFTDLGYVRPFWTQKQTDIFVEKLKDRGLDDFYKSNSSILPSAGFGFRLMVNKLFLIRLDVGFSAMENYSPRIYLKIGNVF